MKKLIVLSLLLSACVGPRVFNKPGASTEDFNTDHAACRAQAMAATTYQQNPFMAAHQEIEITAMCLNGKGWREQAR